MNNFADLVNRALIAYRQEDYEQALRLSRRVVAAAPHNISAHLIIGNVFYVQRDYSAAAQKYREILELAPQELAALINLADCYLLNADYDQALSTAGLILSQQEFNQDAFRILGSAYAGLHQYADSVAAFQEALQLDSHNDWIHNYLSQSCQQNGDYEAALNHAWQAVEISGGQEAHHINFAYALYEIALEKGTAFITPWQRRWQKKYGRDALVSYAAKALAAAPDCTRAAPRYVQKIFDAFAESFESSLSELGYTVPGQIAAAAHWILPPDSRPAPDVLDAGCGTGWCAEKLLEVYPQARFFGVDLSPKMLAEAAQKNIYYQLAADDIESWLATRKNAFDLIVAADVFTYFGDLKKLLKLCAASLHPNSALIFSATRSAEDSAEYVLHLSGRFHHGRRYLRRLLKKSGFRIKKMPLIKLRSEAGQDVMGWIVTAVKN